ncbi:MAG: type II 3-dehydroquinate dehydratase [Candidatus Shikimatogenerans sp. Ttur]|uniref:3-dehydroquinate dehydratase n=1 Tax=Candidatus Shikimatogenerans sp. Ttur TaxID=3158569 RepID=A0AAU7ZXL4_9FLAO
MKKYIYIINGPNLNFIGKREIKIYGNKSFNCFYKKLKNKYKKNIKLKYFQTNSESKIINKLYKLNKKNIYGILLNAAAYSHTSLSILDCIKSIKIPVIEIHISNIYKREKIRNISLISKNCKGIIVGFGLLSYDIALYYFCNK